MKIVDPFSASALREILSLNVDPHLMQRREDTLIYKGIIIGRLAIMIDGVVFNHTDIIKGIGRVEDIIRAAWSVAEKIFQQRKVSEPS